MIQVTRLDGSPVVINAELIELVETTPDTVLSLTTSKKMVIRESVQEVVDRIVRYNRMIHGDPTIRRVQRWLDPLTPRARAE